MKTKHTQGEWKVSDRITNGVEGYEIHYTDDEECITDHVYTLADAKLIAAAPKLLQGLIDLKSQLIDGGFSETSVTVSGIDVLIKEATK